jgi:hypothetical protein
MSLDTLPKTLQDAIEVTRELGLRYLWVDALCIVQDDLEDFNREAANMDYIYEGAHITLSITLSKDVDSGFLSIEREQPPSGYEISKLSDPGASGQLVPVYMRYIRPYEHDHGMLYNPGDRDATYPLMLRAWAFQERFLAKRTLHFSPWELVWECKSTLW